MKNVIASALLILALLLSFFLYRSGNRYQESLNQEPMTVSCLPGEEEEKMPEPERTEEGKEEKKAEKESGEPESQKQEEAEEEIPSRAEGLAGLQETLRERISRMGGDWSLEVRYIPSGEGIGIDSRPMVAASLIKLYIAGAYLEAAERGDVQDEYDASLKSMLSQSDNEAANRLIHLLGMDYINAFILDHGFEDTKLNRLMLENNGLENYTSVSDCTELLGQVYAGTYVNAQASERILSALKEQKVRTKIPAGLPEGTGCANKTGELAHVENDTAIVFAPGGDYIFCVMSENVSPGTAHAEIQEMSRIIYETLGEEMTDTGEGE